MGRRMFKSRNREKVSDKSERGLKKVERVKRNRRTEVESNREERIQMKERKSTKKGENLTSKGGGKKNEINISYSEVIF